MHPHRRYGIWILVNLASLDVPLWVVTCRFLLALLDVPWKPWQQHFAVHQIAIVWNFTIDSRWQKLCGYQKSKKKKARVICSCDCQSHSLVLSCFPCFCLCIVCFPLVMGSFEEGERIQSVSQGEGAVIPAPRIRSFPQPQVTWFRDGRKIPPSSRMWVFFSCCFSVFLFVGPFVSYLAFLFDSRNIFWVCFFFPFFFLCPWRCLRALVWEQLFLSVVCFSSC